jgi:hypothetical protein
VSPVVMVPPVVVVSPGVDMLAGLWVASVSPVLAMRWFSFVHEGFKSRNRNQMGCSDSEHPGSGMSMRKSMLICVVRRANTPELKSLIEKEPTGHSLCAI